jgi:hypothetical protein
MRQNIFSFSKKSSLNSTKISTSNTILILLLIYTFCTVAFSQPSMSAATLLTTINANTTYQFTIVNGLINTVSNTSAVIEISFPTNFFAFNISQAFTCINTDTPSISYPCRATTTNVIQINNPLIGSVVFRVSISTIKNPSSQESVTFSYVFKYSNQTIVSQASVNTFITYTPGSLVSCSVSFNPNTVHSTS